LIVDKNRISSSFTSNLNPMLVWGISVTALLGLIFGSFLNVCISRLPHGQSIVRPRSHCMHCGTMIPWYDNLPVVSWILLRGRCRSCKWQISWRYPLIELGTAALWVSCWLVFYFGGDPLAAPLAAVTAASRAVFCYLLLGLAVMDWETLLLPDEFTLTGIGLGVVWQIFWCLLNATSTQSAVEKILLVVAKIAVAAFVVLAIRWIYQQIRHREGMGLGDAKLMAMLAAWLGLEQTLLVFFLAVVSASLFALLLLAAQRKKQEAWAEQQIPLGTFLCFCGIYAVFFGEITLHWYESFLK
jgi:leader peptidase (prepilin peptidase) / N-methyltransferase